MKSRYWGLPLLAFAIGLQAAPPAEVFFKDPEVVEAALSPSGRLLAVSTARGMPRIGLVVFDLAPGGKAQRVAQFSDGDVAQLRWQDDSRLLFSVYDFAEGSGRPRGAPGLFAVNADGKDLRMLVKRKGTPVVSERDPRRQALEWNHRLIEVPTRRAADAAPEVLIGEMRFDEVVTLYPLWLDTRSGRTRRADIGKAPSNAVGWITDRRGQARVVFTLKDKLQAAYWRRPGQDEWHKLYEADLLSAPFVPHSVDDAGTLYVVRREGARGNAALVRFDAEKGAPEADSLVAAPGFDFEGQLLSDDEGRAIGVRLLTDAETTVWFTPAMKQLQQLADQQLPGRVNRIDCRRCGQPDMRALVRSFSDQDPGQLWLYQAQPPQGESAWQAVGRVQPGVAPAQMGQTQLERIRARDGRELPVWLTTPPGKATRGLPAIVLVHGGPWVRGRSWDWQALPQFLATRGYLVIEPEFRGSTGYGHAHFRAGFQQWGRAMQDDVADALLWARQQGLAGDKACIAGASYGGYSTLMGLVRQPELYRCGAAWVAVADLPLLLEGSHWVDDDTSDIARKHSLPQMVYDARTQADLVRENSPVHQAQRIQVPLLLAYGSDDLRVPLAHGERLRKALRAAGREPEWVVYDGEGHGWAKESNRLDFAQRLERFFAQHLQTSP